MFRVDLSTLWYLSLLLAALSIISMIALIINRLISTRAKEKQQAGQADLTEYLLTFDPDEDNTEELSGLTRSTAILAMTISEISTMMRGPDFDDIMSQLAALDAENRLIALLQQKSAQARIVAAEALAFFPTEQTRKALWKAYARRAPASQRIIIAQALITAGAKPELADFFAHLDLTKSEDLADMASLFSTIAMKDPEPIIRRVKIAYDPPEVRAALLRTLGNFGVMDAIDLLVRDACDENPIVRAAALEAIGAIGFLPDTSVIAIALKDASPEVRAEAAGAVGLIMDDDHFDDLIELVSDDDWEVRFRASKSLSAFGDEGVNVLKELSNRADDQLASSTAQLTLDELSAA